MEIAIRIAFKCPTGQGLVKYKKRQQYGYSVFLVGAFPLREKFPTIAVTVFSQHFSIKGKMPDYSSDCF